MLDLTVARMGHRGDGLAETEQGTIYVPFVLPGERLKAAVSDDRGYVETLVEPSPDRRTPACPHFTICGGCTLQHWDEVPYKAWKVEQLTQTLAQQGIESVPFRPLVTSAPGERRRATFAAERRRDQLAFGFYESRTRRIVNLSTCPVLDSRLTERFSNLRDLAGHFLNNGDTARIRATAIDNGVDVDLSFQERHTDDFRPGDWEYLSAAAAAANLARLSVGGDTVAEIAPPTISFSGVDVQFPAGAFLQATQSAEAFLVARVKGALRGCSVVADLFCGLGPFTFALARHAVVISADADAASVAALSHAADRASGLKSVKAHVRNLYKRPFSSAELNRFDGAVFDPPRAGAKDQAAELAASKLRRIVAVSCNPATFARDARILLDGGYTLTEITPVDQFIWSPHIELIAVFDRI